MIGDLDHFGDQLTVEEVIDALGVEHSAFAKSLFDGFEPNINDDHDDDDNDQQDDNDLQICREYAYYHVLHQLDTSFEANARARRLRLRRDARQWSEFPSSTSDSKVQFASDRHRLLSEKPHINVLLRLLRQWRDDRRPPTVLAAMPLLVTIVDGSALLDSVNDRVVELLRRDNGAVEALRLLGVDGVCSLLALRITAGTARGVLPPSLQQCWRAFSESHTPGTRLTVGARALTKHFARSSERFWGASIDGSDAEKNINAARVLARIVDDIAWLNLHALPHDTLVFEMRNAAQYGARWELSRDRTRCEFRGFLEPQLDDGHATGWRH